MTNLHNSRYPVIAIPVYEWTWMATQDITSNMRSSGFTDFNMPEEFFKELILHSINDAIDDKSLWIKRTLHGEHVTNYLNKFEWFNGYNRFSGHLITYVEEYVAGRIKEIFKFYIPEKTWEQWEIKELKPSTYYALVRGEDFRITDHRRLKDIYEPDIEKIADIEELESIMELIKIVNNNFYNDAKSYLYNKTLDKDIDDE